MHNLKNFISSLVLLSTVFPVLTELPQKNITDTVSLQGLAEGGNILLHDAKDETHSGREHISNKLNDKLSTSNNLNSTESNARIAENSSNNSTATSNNSTATVIQKPTEIDVGISKKNDEKQSVAKKGVSFNATDTPTPLKETPTVVNNTTVSSVKPESSTTKILKKPLITEHDDAKFVKSDPSPKIPDVDPVPEKKNKRADYVIPIVAVILSVPLVAIALSFIYKRGTDWWQHRNYRRMDFLIEGMYNN